MRLLGVHHPFDGHVPSLREAQRLQDAHARGLARRVFPYDLAHGKLQRQPVLALLLLGHVAQQAAHRQRNARLLAPAQAQLQVQYAAVGCMVAQRRALHGLAVQRAAEQRRRLGPHVRGKQILEGMKILKPRGVHSEAALPRRIGIEKLSCRAERGQHLGGVLEEVAVPLLRLALHLLAVQDRALVHGHGHRAGKLARRIAQRRDVQRHGQNHAILAAHPRIEAGHHAGRQRTHAIQIGGYAPGRRGVRRPIRVAELLHLRQQPLRLTGGKNVHCPPQIQEIHGAVAQQSLGRGIAIDQLSS